MSIFTRENGFVAESDMAYTDEMLARLNKRYRMFMGCKAARFKDARVLDLASHDGRWCLAAARTGAAHVLGIEYRQSSVDKSSFIFKPDDAAKIDLRQGDIFEDLPKLRDEGQKFDIVMCLGIFYHILDHHRLLKLMHSFEPKLIIIDSVMVDSEERFVRIGTENTETIRNTIPSVSGQSSSPIGLMSVGGLRHLARHFGYKLQKAPIPKADVTDKTGIEDYLMTNYMRATRRYAFFLEPV